MRNRASDGVGVAMYPVPSSGSNTIRLSSVRYVSVMKYMLAIILIMASRVTPTDMAIKKSLESHSFRF